MFLNTLSVPHKRPTCNAQFAAITRWGGERAPKPLCACGPPRDSPSSKCVGLNPRMRVLYGRARLGGRPVAHLDDPKNIGVSYMIFGLPTLGL